ncbi:MAG: hypothetical protein IJ362_00395 [Oscillospiraceae bacterium]|nr:hypothetical protein [Oscillospiraceae bacterium]
MKAKEKQIELFFSTWQKIDALYAEYARRNKAGVITETGKNYYKQVLWPVCQAELAAINQLDEREWEQLVKLMDKYASIFRTEIKKI